MEFRGTLLKIASKSGTGKRGPWTLFSLKVATEKQGEMWFNYGFDAPKVQEGSVISFDATEDDTGRYRVDTSTVKVDRKAAAKVAVTEDHRQDSIVRQNATTTAAKVVRDMIDVGAVTLPKKQAEQYDAYLELITEVTNYLFLANRNAPSVEELTKNRSEPDSSVEDLEDEDEWPEE